MSTLPLEDHSLYERERLARINATPAAPESFDPIAALRRVEALADDLRLEASEQDAWDGNCVAAYEEISDRIRAALAPQAGEARQ